MPTAKPDRQGSLTTPNWDANLLTCRRSPRGATSKAHGGSELSVHVIRRRDGSSRPAQRRSAPSALVLVCSIALVLTGFSSSPALSSQSRDQCEKCCKSKETDEYYLDQCRLKCYRAPNHCAAKGSEERAEQPSAAPAQVRKPVAKPRPARKAFQYPNPLRLVPGKEWEAAGLILTLNGIPPQHPNHGKAMQSMVAVLTDFVKRNPQGGSLPTTALERIVKKFK